MNLLMGYFSHTFLKGLGKIWVACGERGLARIAIGGSGAGFLSMLGNGKEWREDDAPFRGLFEKLDAYSRGVRVEFDEAVDLRAGTPFQQKVWRQITRIPWGETRSYKWLAEGIGNVKAVRAVAQACGANTVPIIIPCHRVIASDGTMGGFSCGIRMKRKLLKLEEIALMSTNSVWH